MKLSTRIGPLSVLTAALAPLFLAALAFALRVYRLDVQSLWLDEGLSVIFARPRLLELLPLIVVRDIHPPFYIVTLHFWMEIAGQSEFAVRYLSVAFGVLLVPSVYRLAVDLFGDGDPRDREAHLSGLIAAILVAVSPFLVYYSQEARNYIAVTFWTVISCLAFWRALRVGSRRWWIAYSVTGAAVVYTHYYGGFVLAAQAAYMVVTWARNRRRWRSWLAAAVGSVVLYIPWLIGLQGQLLNILRSPDYWLGTIDFQTVMLRMFASFSVGRGGDLGPVLVVFALSFAVGALVLLRRGGLRSGRGELFLIFYAVIPLLAVYAITARNPKFAERYLIIISPAFYLVLARGLAALYGLGQRLGQRWLPARGVGFSSCVLGVALMVGFSASTVWQIYYGPEWAKDDYRGAISYIDENSREGDFILLVRDAYHPMEYYYQGSLPWAGFDPAPPNKAPNPGRVAETLAKHLTGKKRVWLLLWQEEVVDPTGTVAGMLRGTGRQVPLPVNFSGVRLALFDLPEGATFASGGSRALDVAYENGVRLQGIDLLTPQVRPGEAIDLALYWQATRVLEAEFGLGFGLKDERGFNWASETHRPSGQFLPTSRWPHDHAVRGSYLIGMPLGTPPGRYTLELNVHDAATLRELSRVMPSGQPVGARLDLAQVEVLPAEKSPAPVALVMKTPLEATFGESESRVALLGRGALPVAITQGSAADLSLYWERLAPGGAGDVVATITLAGAEKVDVASAPLVAGYPLSSWKEEERLRGQYRLSVPPTLPAGDYEVRLALATDGGQSLRVVGGETSLALGMLTVTDLPRVWTAPVVETQVGARFGDVATLYGYRLATGSRQLRVGEKIDISLVWQAAGTAPVGYSVFVHLADTNQRPWSQHDGPPANGGRPTTSWLAGEYVEDDRTLTIKSEVPAGRYQVLVGMYGPNGTRLEAVATQGRPLGNAVPLTGLEIEVVE